MTVIWTKSDALAVTVAHALWYFWDTASRSETATRTTNPALTLDGKIALILAKDHERNSGPFGRGALAVRVINHPKFSGYSWELV